MKKLILLCSLLFALLLQVNAQSPTALSNPSLETWSMFIDAPEQPNGWLTPNMLKSETFVPGGSANPTCVEKVSGAGEVTDGTYAMKINTVTLSVNPYPEYIPDVGGVAFMGAPVLFPTVGFSTGFAVQNFEPLKFSYDRKYAPNGTDTAFCNVVLTHYNTTTNKRDTVAFALDTVATTLSSYESIVMDLSYVPAFVGTSPDTCMIAFSSSSRHLPVEGSVFHVDNLAFTFLTNVKAGVSEDGFMIYPNPTNDRLFIAGLNGNIASKAYVYNNEGQLVKVEQLNLVAPEISTSNLDAGIYNLQILNKSGEIISRKKFTVVK